MAGYTHYLTFLGVIGYTHYLIFLGVTGYTHYLIFLRNGSMEIHTSNSLIKKLKSIRAFSEKKRKKGKGRVGVGAMMIMMWEKEKVNPLTRHWHYLLDCGIRSKDKARLSV